ncbi:hypothetical protein GCM10025870_09590 [Agromyces marinus]|uniref:Calcineurin-like phosphoesterase domain-containing protein n=1 Tax=Agromyces marinus TaxID=1389020 RepID=A0ABN6YA19_9MICO|nr:hypothetical protein GCM10025870_09590 [Agromyces marinus]
MGDGFSPVARIALAIGAAGAAAFAWGSLVERRRFTLRRVEVPVLPTGAEPIRVLHVSDLHMAPWQRDKQEWVAALADLRPDLVIDTGDNLGHRNGLEGIRRAFSAFRGVPGVFVNGSNDYFGPVLKNPLAYFGGPSGTAQRAERLDTAALHAFFGELGWLDLDNAAASIEVNGTHLEFIGVDDPHRGYDRLELVAAAIDDLRADDPYGDESWPDLPGNSPSADRSRSASLMHPTGGC